jgi:hypothetical protein
VSIVFDWGTTAAERARSYPCDALLRGPECFRGVSVAAPPAVVFRWLCQLRAAPYSYDLIDNLGRRSPRTLTPGLDALAVGQRVMTIFRLVAFERDRHLTLRTRGTVVTYAVLPDGEGSRLVAKLIFSGPLARAMPWLDLPMMRRQLLNLKALAEEG